MIIFTHRGLDPFQKIFFTESSYEAFQNHLQRGFGIEFDVNFTKDGEIIIFHDSDLKRITNNQDQRAFQELMLSEIKDIRLNGNRISDFDELMDLIIKSNSKLNALHLKGKFQEKKYLDILLDYLSRYKNYLDRLIIFDIKIETARYLKNKMPELVLAPSVAHLYDIKRYNEAVAGTLISIDEAIRNRDLFDWAWLDEWDRVGEGGADKKFYTAETFLALRNAGLKLALVTPELHGTSPGLLGGEAHSDAQNKESLFERIKEITNLGPDAICTDYPNFIKQLISSNI